MRNDSAGLTIPLEKTLKNNYLIVGGEMFEPIDQGDFKAAAFNFLAGTYFKGGKVVQFGKNGSITGLDSFMAFKPVVDYSQEPGNGDRIWLKSFSGNWKKFGLQVSEIQGLEIFEIRQHKFGKQIYQLQRQVEPIDL